MLDQLDCAHDRCCGAARAAELAQEAKCPFACRNAAPVLGAKDGCSQEGTFDDRDGWIWFDGELVEWRDAKVHVLTHALHYASSVFEGQRAYNGKIFKLREHRNGCIKARSCSASSCRGRADEIDAACEEVLKANGFMDAYMRPVAWRGIGIDGRRSGQDEAASGDRCVAMGKYFERGARQDRRPARHCAVAASGALHRADGIEGGRTVHDLHSFEAACGKPRLSTTR